MDGTGPACGGAARLISPDISRARHQSTSSYLNDISTKRDHIVPGTPAAPEGITNPPIDDLLKAADSKYALVIYSAKRARQINAYYSQLGEGLLEYVGPLVETHVHEKPLSIALREIDEGLLTSEPIEA
jgi:DNA-directed RNA polymerase subunit omega